MLVKRITKISNPRRRATARKRSNPRKSLSAKQIKFFGTKAQRSALKRRRSNPKRPGALAYYKRKLTGRGKFVRKTTQAERARGMGKYSENPRRRRKTKAKNPAHLLTFGLAGVNPKPRKKRRIKATMPATKKRRVVRRRTTAKSNPRRRRKTMNVRHRRRSVARASNPKRHRRRNTRVIVKNSHRRRRSSRNPSILGISTPMGIAKLVVSTLGGVTITKAIPNMLPASMMSTPVMRVLSSFGVALLSGYLAHMFTGDPVISGGITLGGLAQAGSVGLNSFLPSVGATIGLQGLGGGIGDLIAGSYPIPQNPLFPQYNPGYGGGAMPSNPIAALPAGHPAKMASAPMTTGVAGIFGSAF